MPLWFILFLSLNNLSFDTYTQIISFTLSIIFIILLIGLLIMIPIFSFYYRNLFFKMYTFSLSSSFFSHFFCFFGDFKLKSWMSRIYYFFFFLRRIIYALMIVFAWKSMILECSIFLSTTVLMFGYLLMFRPFKGHMNLLNEIVLIINGSFFFGFRNDKNEKFWIIAGYCLIGLLIFIVGLNTIVTVLMKLVEIVLWIFNYCKKSC